MRLISTIHKAAAEATAKIYRDTEWNEYRVKFYQQGQHLQNADYHTDCKEDAHSTAHGQLQRMTEQ
jgi:hypothetical protein